MGTCQGLNSPHCPRIVTSIRQGARKAAGSPSALMQLPTPEDCMATMARVPASQQPVAMAIPSSSVDRVTRRMLLPASISLRSWVKPPSGMVQTVAILRALMARTTSSGQFERITTPASWQNRLWRTAALGNLRQPPYYLQWAKIAHAGGECRLQWFVDVGDVAGNDFPVGCREDVLVDAIGPADVVEHAAAALFVVIDRQSADVVLVFDAIDGVGQGILRVE